jgi:hypothetical protein
MLFSTYNVLLSFRFKNLELMPRTCFNFGIGCVFGLRTYYECGFRSVDVTHSGQLSVFRLLCTLAMTILSSFWKELTKLMSTSRPPSWNRTYLSFWRCWASGTLTSTALRLKHFCHTTSICTALPLTSNKVTWNRMENL